MADRATEFDDVELGRSLALARRGDHDAFATLVARHQSMVYSIALHALRDRAVAEDLAQDIFLRLYRSLEDIESVAHLTFWLRRTTSNRCIDELRRPRLVTKDLSPDLGAASQREPDHFLNRRLKTLVTELPDAQRMAVILRYQEELEPAEISRILDVPLNTIKSHLRRALAAIRVGLQPAPMAAAEPLPIALHAREMKS